MKQLARVVGTVGLSSVIILVTSLLVFGFANDNFSFLNDFISELGARGEPYAFWFNLVTFVLVGLLLFVFGLSYGLLLNDKVLSFLLSLFGLGFGFTAIPVDLQLADAPVSKAHVLAICLGLAFWMFGLSRLGYSQRIAKRTRNMANCSAVFLLIAIIGFVLGAWSMPITHRLIFAVVFGWIAITSVQLIISEKHITPKRSV
ncbi:DUF998 domain-containing protein [Marinoscillum furvescens]|nr:DUF998 domain-containing protein [Marinoscillum furvescens]